MFRFLAVYDLPAVSDRISGNGEPDFEISAADTIENIFEEYGAELWFMFALGVLAGILFSIIYYGIIKLLGTEYDSNNGACNNKNIKTNNGINVQTLFEKIICDELFNREIKFEYKKNITHQDENGTVNEFHPDFYLTDYKLCIKHFSSHDKDREEKLKKFYEHHGYLFAVITNEDIKDIQSAIEKILLENDINI